MKEQDIYYGCVFSQILQFNKTSTITKIEGTKGLFSIDDERQILIKYSTQESPNWEFSFSKKEIALVLEAHPAAPVYIAFVCAFELICLLNKDDLTDLINHKHQGSQTISLQMEKRRALHLQCGDNFFPKVISPNSFPALLFEDELADVAQFAWPPLSTVNTYIKLPVRIFSSTNRNMDLADVLTKDLDQYIVRVRYVGVSSKHPDWAIWDEEQKQKVESRITYLFEFEGFSVDIKRITVDHQFFCDDEFVWKIEFWRDEPADSLIYEHAKDIVLESNEINAKHIASKLGITENRSDFLFNLMEEEGLISPIRINKPKTLLNKNADACYLFLDANLDAPEGATLCHNADEAMALLDTGRVIKISFSYYFGDNKTGYDVAKYIEQLVARKRIALPEWRIHASTPTQRKSIRMVMNSAKKFEEKFIQEKLLAWK